MDLPGAAGASASSDGMDSQLRPAESTSLPSASDSPYDEIRQPKDQQTENRVAQQQDESSDESEDQDEEDDDEEEDEEPRLKYVYATKCLPSLYRGGDATSTFRVAGDKMV
jgi:predicted RNA polymerase sigma factor